MLKVYPDIRALGGEVLVVSFTPPTKVAAYMRKYPFPFPVVSDPALAAYHGFALGRTSLGAMLRLALIWRFLKAIVRGWLPKKPDAGEDILQLGGDFVLDSERRLVYPHPSAEPTDRPAAKVLLKAVRQAARR